MFQLNLNRLKDGSHKYLLAEERGYQEGDLPPFTVADVDFYMPKCLQLGLIEYIKNSTQGYNKVNDDYIDTVKNWMKSRHIFSIENDWIIVTHGVIYAIANALYAFTKEEDAVCIMSPVYHVFYRIIEQLKRKTVIHNLKLEDNLSYSIDFEILEKQFKQENVKVLVFCSPHNPIGKVWSKEDLIQLSKLCDKYQVLMISDEIHFDLILKGHKHTVYPSINELALNHTILCTSASKTFNLAGLKVANIIIPNEYLRKQYVDTFEKMSLGLGNVNEIGLKATQIVYEDCDDTLDSFLELINMNYNTINEFLKQHLPEIKVSPLEGSYLLWIDFRQLGMTQNNLQKELDKSGLYLSNGVDFGRNAEGFMRMNIATSNDIILKAMEKLKTMIEDIGGNNEENQT